MARAEGAYPAQPISWICPYGAGGNADARSRQFAKALAGVLGQGITVDNKAGTGGNVGTAIIAKSKPDGYTIGMGNFAPLAVNQALFPNMAFNSLVDLTPIMLIERGPLVLTVPTASPFKSVADVVKAAKATPNKLIYASGGAGGSHHLSGALLEYTANIDLVHLAYRSGAAATADLMTGQVQMMFEQMYEAAPGVKSGKLRALAITSKARSPLLPGVPTMAEVGYPAVDVNNWQGLIGPANLPEEIVKVLNRAANTVLQGGEVRDQILGQGNELGGGTPEAFAALIKEESARWSKVVKQSKITLD